jgi:hypothetical protein
VELEITPEPTPEERAAIVKALAALAARDGRPGAGGRGEWWRRGQQEAVEQELEPDGQIP